MKKLLSSKKSCLKSEGNKLYRDPPKRTISSAWNTRNDSSNVSSILQPDKRENTSEIAKNETKGVYKKCLLSENSCYCYEKKIKPKLMSRPKTCLSLEKLKRQLVTNNLTRRPIEQRFTVQDCLCKDAAGSSCSDSTDMTLFEECHCQEEFGNKCECLKYTQSRKDYESFRRQRAEEHLRELENYHAAGSGDAKKPEENEESLTLSTILGTRLDTTRTASSRNTSEHDSRVVEDLTTFRKEHYFETHTTEDLQKEIADHTCVHQFKLDDRLLPEPLNVDPYGRSRCSLCSRPMEGDTMQLSKSYFGSSVRNLAKGSELGLVPRRVSIGGSKSKIELRLDADAGDEQKFGMFVGKVRRPAYFNTFALRQQRMAC